MARQFETLTGSVFVLPANEPIFSEMATKISLEAEAAGMFVVVEQDGRDGHQKIAIDSDEWPAVRDVIDSLMITVRQRNGKEEA